MSTKQKWVHFIGICGVTMASLANMFKKTGWFVTGSDRGIFPPMSDYLKDRKIDIELGFKEEHLKIEYYKDKNNTDYGVQLRNQESQGVNLRKVKGQFPDLVVVGNYIGLSDKEYKFAKKNKLTIKSYPEVLEEFLVKSNSIVTAGTYGKTTSTALLAQIFQKAGKNPSFMIGGLAKNFDDGIKNSKGDWSIIEGDEYISARFNPVSKFFHYKAEFVLLTSCAWDHTDFFKTEEDYVENFRKFIRSLPLNGIVVANKNGANIENVISEARCKVVTYELNKIDNKLANSIWFNLPHKENKETSEVVIFNKHTKEEFSVKTKLIGEHNKENIIGVCALARELDVEIEPIQKAVEKFEGIKRRLDVRFEEENLRVIDDHACSPSKVLGSLNALRETYPDWHITVIFEPNVGNRTKEALMLFEDVFNKADEVIIPHLKPVRTVKGEEKVSGEKLADFLKSSGANVIYIDDDDKLVNYVSRKDVGKHVICFMGAYGWRNMIEEVIKAKK